jgi:hypothetical protein
MMLMAAAFRRYQKRIADVGKPRAKHGCAAAILERAALPSSGPMPGGPAMDMRIVILLSAALVCGSCPAADPTGLFERCQRTLATAADATTKRELVHRLQQLGPEWDDAVIPLLVLAVDDRQTHDEAVLALRQRTGLHPTLNNRGTGYPEYPITDEPADWNAWLEARDRDLAFQAALRDQAQRIDRLERSGRGR